MDEQIVTLLIKRMDDHKDESIRRLEHITESVLEIREDVKSIMKAKWKVSGISAAALVFAIFVWELIKLTMFNAK
jgi:hypothetical protein